MYTFEDAIESLSKTIDNIDAKANFGKKEYKWKFVDRLAIRLVDDLGFSISEAYDCAVAYDYEVDEAAVVAYEEDYHAMETKYIDMVIQVALCFMNRFPHLSNHGVGHLISGMGLKLKNNE